MTPGDAGQSLDARREQLEVLTSPGGPLHPRSPYATVSNRDWYTDGGRPTEERLQLHNRLIAEFEAEAPGIRQNRQAVVVVGPPGAGKSGVSADIFADTQTGPDEWRRIDPDDFRDRLALAMQKDGSISRVVPPEVRSLQPSARELSSQLFVESAKLAARAQIAAMARGDNLIIEGAYADEKRLDDVVKTLEKKGYDVHLATVDVTQDDAMARTQERYRTEALKATQPGAEGKQALGGRFVSAASLAGHFDEQGMPKATESARTVAAQRAGVQSVRQYTVATADAAAQLTSFAQRQRGLQPVDAQTYRSARVAGVMSALPSTQHASVQQSDSAQLESASGDREQGRRPEHLKHQQGGSKQVLDR